VQQNRNTKKNPGTLHDCRGFFVYNIQMNLGYSMSFLFYIIPALCGILAAIVFVKNETRGKSLDQLAEEQMNL